MLTIKAHGSPGMDLREQMLPEMLSLAKATGCRVEVSANETLFWAHPTDFLPDLQGAYDRLYPDSRIVAVQIASPVNARGAEPITSENVEDRRKALEREINEAIAAQEDWPEIGQKEAARQIVDEMAGDDWNVTVHASHSKRPQVFVGKYVGEFG